MIEQIEFSDELSKIYRVYPPEMERLRRVISVSTVFERLPRRLSGLTKSVTWALVAAVMAAFSVIGYGAAMASGDGGVSNLMAFAGLVSGAYWAWYGLIAIPKLGDLNRSIAELASASTFDDVEKASSELITRLQ